MKKILLLLIFTLSALLYACTSTLNPTLSPTETQLPTLTATNTLAPTETIIPTTIPTSTQSLSKPQTVLIYLVTMGDNGNSGKYIGCGDSLVPVEVAIEPTNAVLRSAFTYLFNLPSEANYGESGLMNSLYLSSLSIESLNIIDKKALIYLSGELIYGGECDIPRIEEQLSEIALQFSTIDEVEIYVNGVALEELLSLEG